VVISAGIALYGTSNSANAVEASKNATPTKSPAAAPSSGGPEKTSAKHSGSVTAPASSHGLRGPYRDRVRSDALPTTGLITRSQALGTKTAAPAITARTPSTLVR